MTQEHAPAGTAAHHAGSEQLIETIRADEESLIRRAIERWSGHPNLIATGWPRHRLAGGRARGDSNTAPESGKMPRMRAPFGRPSGFRLTASQATGRRGVASRAAALAALVVLVASLAAPAVAAESVRRTWTAGIGGGLKGTAKLTAYVSRTGLLSLDLKGLQPSTIYPVIVYRGTCASPTLVTRLPGFRTDAAGGIVKRSPLTTTMLNAIWRYGRTGAIALKVGSGSLGRCGALRYPVATRVAIPALAIDLPVVRPPNAYPLCNVAMYIKELSQPREAGVTYLYAHARKGMFLPLLERSKINNGASLLGMTVRVWTSDDVLSAYQIIRVRRHVTTLDGIFGITSEQLWLQTSEGPNGTREKLIIIARRLGSLTSDHASAHPTPHPIICS